MHPILEQKKRLGLYLAAWVPVAVLLTAMVALASSAPWMLALALVLPICAVYAFQCLPAWYLCHSFPLRTAGLIRVAAVVGIASVFSASLWLFVGSGWAILLAHAPGFGDAAELFRSSYPLLFGFGLLLFFLAATVSYLLIAAQESREIQQRALEMRILAQEAELKALKAQLDPHFLFNSLNSVMALIQSDPAEARRMCLLLSDFLRKSLRTASSASIPLAEEMSLLEDYLEIERIRFGSRLRTKVVVDADCNSLHVPPLLLQPLIENAISHGIGRRIQGGEISVRASRHGDRLTIRIANPCEEDHSRRARKGIGLENVRGRLAAMCGNDARLDAYEKEGSYYAEITMPT